MKKTKGDLTREKIIEKAARLFLEQGYINTGISSILEAADIPKGSFYFHFKSKNELGISVGEYFYHELSTWFLSILEKTADWNSFVEHLSMDIHRKIAAGEYFGCPFSCFGTETAVIDRNISEVCSKAIEGLGLIFAKAMFRRENLTRKEVNDGFAALSMYEGYLVYFRISNKPETIDIMKSALIEIGESK